MAETKIQSVTYWSSRQERDTVMALLLKYNLSWNALTKELVQAKLAELEQKGARHAG